MPFRQPLVGGTPVNNPGGDGSQLLIDAIRSRNYLEAQSGWKIGKDGEAEFQEWVSRSGSVQTLDTTDLSAENFTVRGLPLDELLDRRPRGIVGRGWRTTDTISVDKNEASFFQLNVGPLYAGRLYRLATNNWRVVATNIGGGTNTLNLPIIEVRYSLTGNPGVTSPILDRWFGQKQSATAGSVRGEILFTVAADVEAFRIRFYAWSYDAAQQFHIRGAEVNIQAWVEDIGPDDATNYGITLNNDNKAGGTGDSTTDPAPKVRYDKTFAHTWIQSYRGDGAKKNAGSPEYGTTYAYQGYTSYASFLGNQQGFFGFDDAAIRSALAGSTIIATYIYLDNAHTYGSSGARAQFGTHNNSNPPASATGRNMHRWGYTHAKGAAFWTGNLGSALGNEFKAGTARGIMVGPGLTTAAAEYAYYNACKIRFIYEK